MRKTLKQQMDESLLELQQAQKRYEQKAAQFNEQEKKAQNKRIAERGAIVEKRLPEIAALGKEQFNAYVEKVMVSNFARKVLAELTAENAPPSSVDTAAQNNGAIPKDGILTPYLKEATAQNSTGASQGGGTGSHANGDSRMGQTSQSGRA